MRSIVEVESVLRGGRAVVVGGMYHRSGLYSQSGT